MRSINVDIENTVRIFCDERETEYAKIYSTESNARLYYTRYMIWHYLHYNRKMSSGRLSREFGRTKRTIFRGMRLLRHQMRYDSRLRKEYNEIVKKAEDAG